MSGLKYPKPQRRPPRGRTRLARGLAQLDDGGRRAKGKEADALWRTIIRAKTAKWSYDPAWPLCARCAMMERKGHRVTGGPRLFSDCMHGFTKGAHPSMRWDPANGLPGCRPCHRRIDSDHSAKIELFTFYLGDDGYAALEGRALHYRAKVDLDLVLIDLRQRVAALPATGVTPRPAKIREPRLDLTHFYWRRG